MTLQGSLGRLHPDLLQAFNGTALVRNYEKGATLYRQGKAARGLFLIQQGRVRLSLAGSSKPLAFHVAGPGAVLGLGEAMSGRPYEATVETLEPVQISFVRRDDLLNYLRDNRGLCLQIVQLLSEDLHMLYDQYRTIGGPPTRVRKPGRDARGPVPVRAKAVRSPGRRCN